MLDSLKKVFIFDKRNIIRLTIVFVLAIVGFILSFGSFREASFGFLFFAFLSVPTFSVKGKYRFCLDIIFPFYIALFVLYYFQLGNLIGHAMLQELYSYWGFLLVQNRIFHEIFFVATVYFLCRLCYMSPKVSAIVTPIPFMLLSLINYYVYSFRGHELVMYDFLSVGTAFNVMGEYKYSVFIPIVFFVLPYLLFIAFFVNLKVEKSEIKAYIKIPVFIVLTVISAILSMNLVNSWYKTHIYKEWGDMPSVESGFYLSFLKSTQTIFFGEPDGYSTEKLNQLLDEYDVGNDLALAGDDTSNIIVIMNESYADLSLYKDLTGDIDNPDPYWDTLKENCVHGNAFSSVFGGNTCNSEYEFLTGLSMAYLPQGSVPYNNYIDSNIYSINWALKDKGYETIMMHPYLSSGWNRTTVYPLLGFDKMMFIDDMEIGNEDIISGKVKDSCAYRNLISVLENKGEKKIFTFMVTIQNHSGYYQEEFVPTPYTNAFDDYNNSCFNTYQTLINESDKALEELFTYLSNQDEKYTVLVFGDHQPELGLTNGGDFNPGGRAWIVPYIIWTNYDIDAASFAPDMGYTSLNYLSLDLLKISGFEYNSYYKVIDKVRSTIPMVNAAGYLTNDGKVFETGYYDNENLESVSNIYNYLEYNQLFDKSKSALFNNYIYN